MTAEECEKDYSGESILAFAPLSCTLPWPVSNPVLYTVYQRNSTKGTVLNRAIEEKMNRFLSSNWDRF